MNKYEEEKWAYDGEDKVMKISWVIICFLIMGLVGCGGNDDDTISCACDEPGAFVDDRSSDDSSDSSSDDSSSSSGCRRASGS